MFKVALFTVGCRANQADSAWLGRSLDPGKISVVSFDQNPDLFVINSCAVTLEAERDVRKAVNRARRLGGVCAKILLTGCMVTASPEKTAELKEVWKIVPSQQRNILPALIHELAQDKIESAEKEIFPVPKLLHRARPSLRVQDGCRMKCTYCAVPAGRGQESSLAVEEVIERIEALSDEGAQEVVLCGINLGNWGHDLKPKRSLVHLLSALEEGVSIRRIRLSSIEPWAMRDGLIEFLSGSKKIAPHLHLPVQSGDDEILSAMNRPYRSERFALIAEKLVRAIPKLSLGTDVIVGFPGEDENRFARTVEFIENLPIAYLHAFSFSPRPGTRAALLPHQLPKHVIKNRVNTLRALGEAKKAAFVQNLIGEMLHPLFESAADGKLRGIAGQYVTVVSEGHERLIGTLCSARAKTVTEKGEIEAHIVRVDGH